MPLTAWKTVGQLAQPGAELDLPTTPHGWHNVAVASFKHHQSMQQIGVLGAFKLPQLNLQEQP